MPGSLSGRASLLQGEPEEFESLARYYARMAELVDALDLGSSGALSLCRFDSCSEHYRRVMER